VLLTYLLAIGFPLALGAAVGLGLALRLQAVNLRTAQEQGGRAAGDYEKARPIHDAAIAYVQALRLAEGLLDTPGFKAAMDKADEALARLRRAVPGEGS
jgi:hypothetical protein